VGQWSIIDFEDQYMLVQEAMRPDEPENETGDQSVQPGEVIYQGPKN
jgi:hypothetical protein